VDIPGQIALRIGAVHDHALGVPGFRNAKSVIMKTGCGGRPEDHSGHSGHTTRVDGTRIGTRAADTPDERSSGRARFLIVVMAYRVSVAVQPESLAVVAGWRTDAGARAGAAAVIAMDPGGSRES
jgi:hypothetical protein